jgi:hypothetical protein
LRFLAGNIALVACGLRSGTCVAVQGAKEMRMHKPKQILSANKRSSAPRAINWDELRREQPSIAAGILAGVRSGEVPRKAVETAFPPRVLDHILSIDWHAHAPIVARDGKGGSSSALQSVIDTKLQEKALAPYAQRQTIEFGKTFRGHDLVASTTLYLTLTETFTFTVTGDSAFTFNAAVEWQQTAAGKLPNFLPTNPDGSVTLLGAQSHPLWLGFAAKSDSAIGDHHATLEIKGSRGTRMSFALHATVVQARLLAAPQMPQATLTQGDPLDVPVTVVSVAEQGTLITFRAAKRMYASDWEDFTDVPDGATGPVVRAFYVQANGDATQRQFLNMHIEVPLFCPAGAWRIVVEGTMEGASTTFNFDLQVQEAYFYWNFPDSKQMDIQMSLSGVMAQPSSGLVATYAKFTSDADAWHEKVKFGWTFTGSPYGDGSQFIVDPKKTCVLQLRKTVFESFFEQHPEVLLLPLNSSFHVSEDPFPAIFETIGYVFSNMSVDGSVEVISSGGGEDPNP